MSDAQRHPEHERADAGEHAVGQRGVRRAPPGDDAGDHVRDEQAEREQRHPAAAVEVVDLVVEHGPQSAVSGTMTSRPASAPRPTARDIDRRHGVQPVTRGSGRGLVTLRELGDRGSEPVAQQRPERRRVGGR